MDLFHPEVGRFQLFDGPFWLQWHLTDRCNGRCGHCYTEGPRRPDPTPEAIRHILEGFLSFLQKNQARGRLQIAGGEPLLAPGLFDLLAAARQARLPVRILSNGLAVTPRLAQELRRLAVRVVQISVEGDQAAHDGLRGNGTYAQARKACRLLTEAGIEVTVAATLHTGNLGALTALQRDFQGLARRVHGARLVPVGEGARLRHRLLSAGQWLKAMRQARRARCQPGSPELLARDPTWAGFVLSGRQAERQLCVSGCAAGYSGLCVDTDGAVYPCRRLPVPVGNALVDELETCLAHPILKTLRDRDRLEGACGRCGLRWHCGGCRAVAWAVHGRLTAADPQCPWPLWRRTGSLGSLVGHRRLFRAGPTPANAKRPGSAEALGGAP
jgi:radical SAM protein with 4Fe4S-binding SPASM domain